MGESEILYKYKGPDKLKYILDILINNRIFCPKNQVLNDILEGDFKIPYSNHVWSEIQQNFDYKADLWEKIEQVEGLDPDTLYTPNGLGTKLHRLTDEIKKRRICSLAKNYNTARLWTFYAQDSKGVAIGVKVEDEHSTRCEIQYDGVHVIENLENLNNMDEKIYEIFSHKNPEWHQEREVKYIKHVLNDLRTKWKFNKELEEEILEKEIYLKVDVKSVYYIKRRIDTTFKNILEKIISYINIERNQQGKDSIQMIGLSVEEIDYGL